VKIGTAQLVPEWIIANRGLEYTFKWDFAA